MKYKLRSKKRSFKILACVLAAILALGTILVVATSLRNNDDRQTVTPAFAVGGLNAQGKYFETDASIYVKKAFQCEGLEVKLDFGADVKYQVFYYNDLDKFISASDVYSVSEKLDVPSDATHARLVVTPIWDADVDVEDRVCHWYDVYKYSSKLEISVSDVSDDSVNLADILEYTSNNSTHTFEQTSVVGYDLIEIRVKEGTTATITYYDEDGEAVGSAESVSISKNGVKTMVIPSTAYSAKMQLTCSIDGLDGCEIYLRSYK